MKLILVLLLACTMGASALSAPQTHSHPMWALHWFAQRGDFYMDQPNCHPLDYFSAAPKRFDYGRDLTGKAPTDLEDQVEMHRIGQIQGFAIYDVIHNINDGELIIKMILVEPRPDEFCEIFQQQFDAVSVVAELAYIVNVSSEKVLATLDRVTGTGAFYIEAYWTFDKEGPIPLDLSIIAVTMRKLLPSGKSIWKGGGFDIQRLCYAMPVWQEGDGNCCPSGGSVRMKFALRNHQLTVLSQEFSPEESEYRLTCGR